MLTVLNMRCASCGANLEIKPDTTSFACGYCGASQTVERHGGTVALKLVTDSIARVQFGTDKTAAELAIVRLQNEFSENDAAHRRAVYQMNAEKDKWMKICLILPVVCLCIFLVLFVRISVGLALAMWGLSLIGIGYIWFKRRRQIENNHTPQIENIKQHSNLLRQRLAKQREIVDR